MGASTNSALSNLNHVHNGKTVEGTYFEMGDIHNNEGGVVAFAPVGKNLVDIGEVKNGAGGTAVFMGGGLQNLQKLDPYWVNKWANDSFQLQNL